MVDRTNEERVVGMIQIAICDDDQEDSRIIYRAIKKIIDESKDFEITIFNSSVEFVKSIDMGQKFEIVFLDYEMDTYNGREIGLRMRKSGNDYSNIIYVSSYSEMIFQLLDADIFQFISKPIDFVKFQKIFLKVVKKVTNNNSSIRVVRNKSDYYITKKNIIYMESLWRQIKVHTVTGDITIYGKLGDFEALLDNPFKNFARIHQSYIANFDHVKYVGKQTLTMDDGMELKISNGYVNHFREAYATYTRRR